MRLTLSDIWAAPVGSARPAIQGVSLDVGAGEWVALGGPNGCGKTTLLLVAAGLLEPRRGVRRLFDDDEGPRPGRSGPLVATILQDPSVQLFAPTVAEEIGLTALHLGVPPAEIRERVSLWSDALGLADELDRAPQTLSAGRQQMVLLAAALASRPDLLVADEAGAHLDAASRERVIALLGAERARGVGILWATQDPDEQRAAGRSVMLDAPVRAAAVSRGPAAGTPAGVAGNSRQAPAIGGHLTSSRRAEPEAGARELPFMILSVDASPPTSGPRIRTEHAFDLPIPGSGIVCLEGANGVGKSVLLGVACGLVSVPQVRVVPGHAPERPPLLVAQYPERQIFEETIGAEMAFAAVARGVDRQEAAASARALLGRLGLESQLAPDRRTWELSTGEKRLVLLVGSLIAPAGLLALDEPTAGLDPERRGALAHLIRERAAAGPVLIASQDHPWVEDLGGKVVRLPPPPDPTQVPAKKRIDSNM